MIRKSTRSSVLTTWFPPFEAGFQRTKALRVIGFIRTSWRDAGKEYQYFVDRPVIPLSYGCRDPSQRRGLEEGDCSLGEEFTDRSHRRNAITDGLYRDQDRHRQERSRHAPKPGPKHQGDEYNDRVESKTAPQQLGCNQIRLQQ